VQIRIKGDAKVQLGETKILLLILIKRDNVKNGFRAVDDIPDDALGAFLNVSAFVDDFANYFHAFRIIKLLMRIVVIFDRQISGNKIVFDVFGKFFRYHFA